MPEIARFSSEDAAQRAMEGALSDILLFRTWNWLVAGEEQTGNTRTLAMVINPLPSQEEADLAFDRLEKAGFSDPAFDDVDVHGQDAPASVFLADFILDDK